MKQLEIYEQLEEPLLLKNCRFLVQDKDTVLENVSALLEDGRIVSIARGIEAPRDARVLDCSRMVALPAPVNAHTHSPMILLRGVLEDLEFHDWLSRAWQLERELLRSPKLLRLGTELATYELLLTGTGTVVDTYLNYQQICELRSLLGPYTFTGTGLRLHPRPELPRAEDLRSSEMVSPVVSVHSLYNVDPRELEEVLEQLDPGIPVSMHLAETRKEVVDFKRATGMFPIEYMYSRGLLKRKWILVHGGWITSREIEILRRVRDRVLIVNCASSNMKLATYGFLPIKELLNHGILVALGTDSPASNNSFDMFQEAKCALLQHRNNYWETALTHRDIFELLTRSFFRFLGRRAGELREGFEARILLVDASSPGLYPASRDRIIAHLIFSSQLLNRRYLILGSRLYDLARVEELYREALGRGPGFEPGTSGL